MGLGGFPPPRARAEKHRTGQGGPRFPPSSVPRLKPLRDEDLRQEGQEPQQPRVHPLPRARPHPTPRPFPAVQQQRCRAPGDADAAQIHHGRERVLAQLPHGPHERVCCARAARPDQPDPHRPHPPGGFLPVVPRPIRGYVPARVPAAEEDRRAGDEKHPKKREDGRCALPQALWVTQQWRNTVRSSKEGIRTWRL